MNASLSVLGTYLSLIGLGGPPLADPLPPQAVARFGACPGRSGSDSHHRAVCVPAHNLLATAGLDASVHVFDLTTGRRLRTLGITDSAAGPLALSPDGKLLAVESRADISLFDLATGKEKARLKGHLSRIDSLTFSPDGRLLASVEGNQGIRVWQVESGKPISHLEHPGYQRFASFTPDSKWLAVLADTDNHDSIRFLNPVSGKEEKLVDTGMKTGAVVFSPDEATIAVTGDQLRVWDFQTRRLRYTVEYPKPELHQRRLCKAAFSPDSKLLATASGQGIQLIEAATGKVVRTIQARPAPAGTDSDGTDMITMLGFAPAGDRLYSWCRNDRLRAWDPSTGTETFHPPGHEGAVVSLRPSVRTGLIVSQDSSGRFRSWEMTTGKEVPLSPRVPADLLRRTLASDGRRLVIRKEDNSVVLVDGTTGKEAMTLPREFSHFAFSGDGRGLLGIAFPRKETTDSMRLWHWNKGQEPDGRDIPFSQGKDGEARPKTTFVIPSANSLSADSRLLAVIRTSGSVQLLEPAAERLLKTFDPPQDSVYTQAFLSPDGSMLGAVFDGHTVRVWDTASHAERGTFRVQLSDTLPALAFAPEGYTLATGGDTREVLVWEVATGQVRQRFKGHNAAVTAVAFSPDGRYLLSGSRDWTALVWEVMGAAQPLPGDGQALWEELGDRDAAAGWQAMVRMIRDPEKVLPWLRQRLGQVSLTGAKQIAQLIRNLDNDSFEEREKTTDELIKLGKEVEDDLKRALGNASAEMRARIERILEASKSGAPSIEKIRLIRALEVLERIGATAQGKPADQAREQLAQLAKAQAGLWLADLAKAALRRLDRGGKK